MIKVVYTLTEPATNWTLEKSEPAALNSASTRLTDECLVALFTFNGLRKQTGSGETVIRDPLYVFAVSD